MPRPTICLALVIGLGLAACDGGEDLAGLIGVQNVPVTLTVDSASESPQVSGESQIQPASFLTRVRNELGHDVARVELLSLHLQLANPEVSGWSALFGGQLAVFFVPDSTGAPLAVAVAQPTNGTDLDGQVAISSSTLDQFPDVAAGRFKVCVVGPAAAGLDPELSQAVLMRLELVAY